jgi:hypothetical protein
MLNHEPNLNPPCDEKLERISDHVSDLTIENLASEILSYGLDEKAKETIFKLEVPKANDLMQETIAESNLEFLLKLVSKKTIEEIREMLVDKLYWKEN